MVKLWSGIAVGCALVAALQWYLIAQRIEQLLKWTWVFGPHADAIDTGGSSVVIFIVATGIFMVLALIAADRLRAAGSAMRFCATLALQMLLVGALVWCGLILSPLVKMAPR